MGEKLFPYQINFLRLHANPWRGGKSLLEAIDSVAVAMKMDVFYFCHSYREGREFLDLCSRLAGEMGVECKIVAYPLSLIIVGGHEIKINQLGKERIMDRPEPVKDPKVEELQRACKNYLSQIQENGADEANLVHGIFEAAMEAVYGVGVWEWVEWVQE